MNSEELSRIGAIGLIAAMVPLVLGLGLSWPALVWVPLALGLPAAVGVYANHQFRTRRQRREWYGSVGAPPFPPQGPETAFPPLPEPAAEEPEYEEYRESVRLPSDDPDYRLNFSCTVCWRATGSGAPEGLRRLAGNTVITRALAVTRVQPATEWEVTAHLVAAELGRLLPDGSGRVEVWAKDVELTLSDEDQRRLDRLGELRKDAEVRDRERDQERAERAYLGDDVLSSTGSATVWWLAQSTRDSKKVEETVNMLGSLATLSAAAHGTEIPAGVRRLIADSVGEGAGGCGATDHQHIPTEHITVTAHPEVGGQQGLFHDGAFHPNGYSSGAHFTVSATTSPWPDGGDPGAVDDGSDALGHVDGLARDLFPPSDQPGRMVFFDRLADLVAVHGGEELSSRIREHYDVPGLPPEDVASPEVAGAGGDGEAGVSGTAGEDASRADDQRGRGEPERGATGGPGDPSGQWPWWRNGGDPDGAGASDRPAPAQSAEQRGSDAPHRAGERSDAALVTPAAVPPGTPVTTPTPPASGTPSTSRSDSERPPATNPDQEGTTPNGATGGSQAEAVPGPSATRTNAVLAEERAAVDPAPPDNPTVTGPRATSDLGDAPASPAEVTSPPPGSPAETPTSPVTTTGTGGLSEADGTGEEDTATVAPPPPTAAAPPAATTTSDDRPSPAPPADPKVTPPPTGPGTTSSTPPPAVPTSLSDPDGRLGHAGFWSPTTGYAPPSPTTSWSDTQHRENGFGVRPWTGWEAEDPPTNGHDPLGPRPDEDGFDQRRPNSS
ncbi:hypothetical protein [Actinoalloteichus caeruleus]|uniref:hypothetical protein n=1 Tax=Actinoalloteichus cyanogriseus TaxID=2893586 RepID=UPI003BB93BCC